MYNPLLEPLTRREHEILVLLAEGLTSREMAERLTLAVSSVRWYVQQIYGKLGVNGKRQAITRAGELGLLRSDGLNSAIIKKTNPNNLPAQLTSFIGHQTEITTLRHLITAGPTRLVTLTGSGGVGKTRLAIRVAEELLDDFDDGIWLVELAPLNDPRLVVQAAVTVLGFLQTPGQSATQGLCEQLRMKHMLLILDNCEQVVNATAELANSLLRCCPHLRILATSREILGVSGETSFRCPSLSLPDPNHLPPLAEMAYSEAVRLFAERAHTTSPDFYLTNANASLVVRICQRLDGIPLAIELAAARVRLLSIEQIASRLEEDFHLLTGGSRTALPRHQTLKALIGWSYNLLSPAERSLLLSLTVFTGSWTLEAAEAVCASDNLLPAIQPGKAEITIQSADILDLLAHLVDKSLVQTDQGNNRQVRYRLLETIRQYGRERLNETGGTAAVRDRHLDYFLHLAELAGPNLRGKQQVLWFDRLDLELDNLRAALEWSLSARSGDGLRLSTVLLEYWQIRGHVTEAVEWLERALAIYAREREGSQSGSPATNIVLGDALNAAGYLLHLLDQREQSKKLLEQSRTIFQQMGQTGRHGLALALLYLGDPLRQDINISLPLLEQSLALFRQLDDKFNIAECLHEIGRIYTVLEQFERARQALEEGLVLSKTLNDQDGLAFGSHLLGDMFFYRGEYGRAEQLYQRSLALFSHVDNKPLIHATIFMLAQAAWAHGDYDQAAYFIDEVVAMSKELNDQPLTGNLLPFLGLMVWTQGDYELARQKGQDSLMAGKEMENNLMIAWSDYIRAKGALSRGDYAQAFALVKNNFATLSDGNDVRDSVFGVETLAVMASAQGKMERAARLFGATRSVWKWADNILPLAERVERQKACDAVQAALGETAFAAAWTEGEKMTQLQAIQYALGGNQDNIP